MPKLNKIGQIEDRLREVERVLIGKGHMRATKQAKAINFVVENMEALQALVEKSRA
jgi:hypothetical protein